MAIHPSIMRKFSYRSAGFSLLEVISSAAVLGMAISLVICSSIYLKD